MKNLFKIFIAFLMTVIITDQPDLLAQGCSDAGFCSAGSLKAGADDDSSRHSLVSLKLIYGSGEQGVTVFQAAPELEWAVTGKGNLQIAIPFVVTSGNLGSTSGIGDLLVAYTHQIANNGKTKFNITGGAKLPTGRTDLDDGSAISLPMPYQTGLGTYDMILGLSAKINRLNVALGIQKVLSHDNNNTFLHRFLSDADEIKYFQSNNLKRGDDILLRAGYSLKAGTINITPGLLAIYRLSEDKYTNIIGNELALEGSDGITLNVTAAAVIPLKQKWSLLVEAGAPAVVRDVRPDGLTRSFVAAFAIRYNFR